MNDLIKVDFSSERPTVSARELYNFLEIRTEFRHWFPRMCEYGFVEGVDFTPVIFDHPQNKQKTKDYQLTIAMAKELCMIQRTEKGKQECNFYKPIRDHELDQERVLKRLKSLDKVIRLHIAAKYQIKGIV